MNGIWPWTITVLMRVAGSNGVLRLQFEGGPEDIPSLYNSEYAKPTDTLYCVG